MSESPDASAAGWLELVAGVAAGDVARVEDLLELHGAVAVTCRARDGEPVFDTLHGGARALWSACEVTGLFAPDADHERIMQAIAAGATSAVDVTAVRLADQAWERVWMDRFQACHFGHGLWVCPSWIEPPERAVTVVRLDPGMAFGTGTHETTALCLEWIAGQVLGGTRLLDYGCGSGVLAIAAAKRGAPRAVGVDIDAVARDTARANAALNQCETVAVMAPHELGEASFDIIVANILAVPLMELAPAFAARLGPRGAVVLSGILRAQTAAVLAAYAGAFNMDSPIYRGDWVRLSGTKKPPPGGL